ncbi:MAG TPA: VCBS repeat-containing protein, partial [Pyrinomonadaceae bacterium]
SIVSANSTPQTLPFTQNWSNTGLITTNDDWNTVPGIVGFLGNYDATNATNVDPRTLLTPFATNDVDVIANSTTPDSLTSGGVAEFEIANPVVALQGSGTADAPHIVIYLNTTGRTDIRFAANVRDIDGSADDAVQQVDVQYRVGATGNYTSVPGGYIADATTGGSATQVTALNLALPAAANNQALVEIRVITTNAGGSDEWVGIDDISVTGTAGGGSTPTPTPTPDAPVDFNGDGKTDFVLVRSLGSAVTSQLRWFYNINGSNAPTVAVDWGLGNFTTPANSDLSDRPLSEDFDGDGKDDIAVWRPGAPTVAAFYILNSMTNTARVEAFGQTGDDPSVVGDYSGDGKADLAVYRRGTSAGGQSTWFYRATPGGPVVFVPWGLFGDFPAPGDYDGDGRNDFVTQRAKGESGTFWMRLATGVVVQPLQFFGQPTDTIVPGDYDGDGKTDLAVVRPNAAGASHWFWKRSSDGVIVGPLTFGVYATDYTVQGDYDGDGRTDIAVWRTNGQFIWRSTATGAVSFFALGAGTDIPVANYNTH